MPTQDTNPPNVTARQRARDYWWQPGRSVGRNLVGVAGRILQSGLNPVAAVVQTGAHVARGEAREGLGNLARSRGWDFNPFNNNRDKPAEAPPAAAREPTFMTRPARAPATPASPPGAAPPSPLGAGGTPWTDGMYQPGSSGFERAPQPGTHLYGSGEGMYPIPGMAPSTAGRQGEAGRFGTDMTGGNRGAAEAYARGIGHANSGLGASSYGRDRLNSQNRMG